MSFEFGGTFTASQFARFQEYAKEQLVQVDGRIAHLKAERDRIGNLAFAYDQEGKPTHSTVDPPTTYCGKLYAAYEALGGDVEHELQVRSKRQAVYVMAGDVTRAPQRLSNGEVISRPGLADGHSGVIMQKLRSFVAADLHRRREQLERKIRRALDYADQLDDEIAQLEKMRASAETSGSMEAYFKAIAELTADSRYFAITDDKDSPDPHGKFARAPVGAYTPGPKGTSATGYERTSKGLVKPTQ